MTTIAAGSSITFTIPTGQIATVSGTGVAVLVFPLSSPIAINGSGVLGPYSFSRVVTITASTQIDYTLSSQSSSSGNSSATLDPATLTSLAYKTAVASIALPVNSLVYLNNSGQLALASSLISGKEAIGFVKAAYAIGDTANYYGSGSTMTGMAGLTIGAKYFMGVTAGSIATAGDVSAYTSGRVIEQIGVASSLTDIAFNLGAPVTL